MISPESNIRATLRLSQGSRKNPTGMVGDKKGVEARGATREMVTSPCDRTRPAQSNRIRLISSGKAVHSIGTPAIICVVRLKSFNQTDITRDHVAQAHRANLD
eukprot:376777-Amorphochlora_amoeboformis.AAC.1